MIIYFDGVCGLCNGFVDFMMKIDHKNIFKYSPLQSDHAKMNLPPKYVENLSSVVVEIDGKIYEKSEAVLEIFKVLGPPWSLFSVFKLLPPHLSNKVYDLVAANRYKVFGKKDSCRLPTSEEREKFIL